MEIPAYMRSAGQSMGKSDLFGRIEGYAGENFTTEILAWILKSHDGVRQAFLGLLLKHRPDLRKAFRSCGIETQQSLGPERPDMTITPASGRRTKLLVEIKTQALETRSPNGDGQIKRYLKHGHVAYLTPRGHAGPDLRGADTRKYQYLGQFSWDQVHSVIREHGGSHDIMREQFLEYLEARHMGPLKPISEDDLRASLHAAEAIRKFQALVDAVREEIEPAWADELGPGVGGKKADSGLPTGDLPYWWFLPRYWKKRGRGTYLCIGVYAEKGVRGRPRFYVELCTEQKKFGSELEENEKLRRLCDDVGWKWDADGTPEYWGYYKTFALGRGKIEDIAEEQVSNVRSEKKNIRKLVKFVEKML